METSEDKEMPNNNRGEVVVSVMIVVVVAAIIGIGSTLIWGDNNIVEKVAEVVIEKETGIDVNLDTHNASMSVSNALLWYVD